MLRLNGSARYVGKSRLGVGLGRPGRLCRHRPYLQPRARVAAIVLVARQPARPGRKPLFPRLAPSTRDYRTSLRPRTVRVGVDVAFCLASKAWPRFRLVPATTSRRGPPRGDGKCSPAASCKRAGGPHPRDPPVRKCPGPLELKRAPLRKASPLLVARRSAQALTRRSAQGRMAKSKMRALPVPLLQMPGPPPALTE